MDIKNSKSGGSELYSWQLCKRLVIEGNSVDYMTSTSKDLPIKETVDGINVTRCGGVFAVYPKIFFWASQNYKNYDLVIEVINGPPFLIPVKVPYSKHLVIIFHLPSFTTTSRKLPVVGPFEFFSSRFLLRLFYRDRKVITDGYSTVNELKALGFKRIYVAEDGLDSFSSSIYSLENKSKMVVIIGPLKPWKRIHHGIICFSILPHPWKLFIMGYGSKSYINKLKSLTVKLGIEKRVVFGGYLEKEEKIFIISKSSMTIITSEKEGFSLPAIECQRYGCVPVMYRFPGIENSVIPDVTSIVVQNNDLSAMKEALLRISLNEKALKKMAMNAIEYSKQFTWEQTYIKVKNTIMDK